MIGAACFSEKGRALFEGDGLSHGFESIQESPLFKKYTKEYRFKEYRRFVPAIMVDDVLKEAGNPLWLFEAYVGKFNEIGKRIFSLPCSRQQMKQCQVSAPERQN